MKLTPERLEEIRARQYGDFGDKQELLAELDATRAKLAEVEQERDSFKHSEEQFFSSGSKMREERDKYHDNWFSEAKRCQESEDRNQKLMEALKVFDNRRKLAYSLRNDDKHLYVFVEAMGMEMDKYLQLVIQ